MQIFYISYIYEKGEQLLECAIKNIFTYQNWYYIINLFKTSVVPPRCPWDLHITVSKQLNVSVEYKMPN